MQSLKKMASWLPEHWQSELKRIHFGRQIHKGTFVTDEPEFALLADYIQEGDWVLDIGANIGHYTKRFSELVGPNGRVLAFEPIPVTFALLAANVERFAQQNVTLMNVATSSEMGLVGMSLPKFDTGLTNYYQAHVSKASDNALSVLGIPVDSLCINQPVSLVKIDAEGHEIYVLEGMNELLERDHPTLIIEAGSKDVVAKLEGMGYLHKTLEGSPNVLFWRE